MSYMTDFEDDGFCIIRNAVPSVLLKQANSAIDEFRKANDLLLATNELLVEGMLQRVVNLHYSILPLQDLFVASMAAGREVVDQFGDATLYTSLFFELGSQQSLHRDTPYFYSGKEGGYLGVWLALDDADEGNGALIAVRGSHKLPEPDLVKLRHRFHPGEHVPPSSTPLFNAYNEELIEMARVNKLEHVTCKVKRGDLVIWNPATLHGGLPHLDKQRTRRSFVMHITPENMPMKHMDYFFHRDRKIEPIKKTYFSHKGRLLSAGDMVDFRHVRQLSKASLGVFK